MSDKPERHPGLREHNSPAATREAAYDRLRDMGVPKEGARKIAEQSARDTHEKVNRRGR